jgi:hypothetical protein
MFALACSNSMLIANSMLIIVAAMTTVIMLHRRTDPTYRSAFNSHCLAYITYWPIGIFTVRELFTQRISK